MPIQLTRTIKILLVANLVAFVVQHSVDQFLGGDLQGLLGLVPAAFVGKFHLWQLFTYPFLHADVVHLFLNLMMLAFVGGELDALWGSRRFLSFYFFCSTVAGTLYLLFQIFVSHGLHVPMVGASGAIYGLLMAYGLIYGERTLLFMLLFPMKAKYFIWILAGLEFMTSVFSPSGGLSSVAHLGGMAAGFGWLWVTAMRRARARANKSGTANGKKRKSGSHLRLVSQKPEGFEDDSDENPKTWH
ncbi:MAG: rhomboid family intramembrane serine protease [Bdellovibrionales bacterium]|nr:rhomboid family intramembrane serine protease [Bdellovibrionales bacterium]